MEALILAIIIAYAIKKAAEDSHNHWQSAKGANRKASKGKPVRQRATSAARHDTAYWAEQVRGGFPQVRHGLYMGWNAGRVAQLEGWQARAKARADHAHLRARVTGAVREQRRRQAEALDRIRAAARQGEPDREPGDMPPGDNGRQCAMCPRTLPGSYDGAVCPDCRELMHNHAEELQRQRTAGAEQPPPSPSTEGTAMSGDTTYTQQMAELEAIRRDAEEEVNSVRRKRMVNRLDILQSLGLDKDTLSEAAEIDDALQAQEKAAQQTLDATDAAISGLKQRHGGIKEAVDDAPVDKPADPEFYQD
jgi:hypothetical protein